MISRRRFLSTIGFGLAGRPFAYAEEPRRRSRWEMLAYDGPTRKPDHKPNPAAWDDSTITAAWIGHSTVLLNLLGTRILTDPVFSDRIGLDFGLFTLGPKRLVSPALELDELPPIDLILLSHAHLDHLDLPSLRKLNRDIPLIIAKNTYDVVEDLEFDTVYELDWGAWTAVGDLRIEALEARHFGWRYPWEKDRSRGYAEGRSYNSYILTKNGVTIVFGGDTAYHEHFRTLRRRHNGVHLAIMPIGAYDPWINNHANPEQAAAMADHMGAYHILPIHWRTFIQSEEPTGEPLQRLKHATADQPDRIVIDAIGQTWALDTSRIPAAKEYNNHEPLSTSGL